MPFIALDIASLNNNIVDFRSDFPLINAVTEGGQGGKVFSSLRTICIIHKAGFSQVHLPPDGDAGALVDFLSGPDLPAYFHIYDPGERVSGAIALRGDAFEVWNRRRIQLRLKKATVERALSNNDVIVEKIDGGNFDSLTDLGVDIPSKFWDGRDDFLQKGFGFAAFDSRRRPLSVCYSACIANGLVEIDIATASQFRQRGLASFVLGLFVKETLERGLIPNWDCFESNAGSLRTALHLGFEEVKRYDFLSIQQRKRADVG
jgi:hypothetical protein